MASDEFEKGMKEVKTMPETVIEPRKVSDVGIWQYIAAEDGPDRIVWDESIELLYGIEPGTFEETHEAWMEIVHPEDVEKADQEWWAAVEEGRPYQVVYRIIRPDGEVRWVDSRALMLTDEDGNLQRAVGMETDITDRLQRFQQLQITDRVLRHDFRSALTLIAGYAEEIDNISEGQAAELAGDIREECSTLLRSVGKHRDISSALAVEAGPSAIQLEPLIDGAVETVRSDHPEAQITVSGDLSGRVGVVDAFDHALEEAIRNAVIHHDGDEPTVEVAVSRVDGEVEITVSDDGPGIPEEEIAIVTGEQAIDPLHHLSGLGLWLIAWATQRSRGEITIEADESRGSTVTMTVPSGSDN